MTKAASSSVNVSITGSLDPSLSKTFSAADSRMQSLGKSVSDLSRKVGDIGAYRRQQNALKETANKYTEAKAKAAALRAEIAASENPTRKQTAALTKAETAARRAGGAYTEARTKLADMTRELQRSGVNVSKLSTEYKRLQGELKNTKSRYTDMEQSLLRQQRLTQGMAAAWRGIGASVAGGVAAGMVLKPKLAKGLTYDEQLARLADTAVSGGQGYGAAKGQLSEAVQTALKASGGGKREDIIGGLNTLIASGGRSVGEASKDIVPVARAAFASGTPAEEIAQLALKMRGFGVTDTSAGLDVLYRSGQKGGVELSDMAKFLPEQLASARSAGYSGLRGLSEIGAMNQVGLSTAGSPEQAANNVINLLNKLSSPELAKNVKKVTGKDFNQYAFDNQKKGIYKAESFAMLADQQMSKDKRYQALKKEAESASTSEDRAAKIKEMSAMLEGSGMGQLIQDRQALAQALAMLVARKTGELSSQQSYALSGAGGVSQTLGNLQGETFAKTQTAQSALDRANETTFNQISGPLGKLLDVFNAGSEAFPKLTSAAYAAASAVAALAAAGVGAGAYKLLTRGGAAAAGAEAGSAAAGGAAVAGGAAAAGRFGRFGRLAKGGLALAAGGYVADAAAGALGAGGNVIDEKQDDANWARMTTGQKAGSLIPRGIEKVGSLLFMDNLVNSAKADRISKESEMVSSSAVAADAAKTAGEAAKVAAARPNITNHNTVTLSVTAPPGADAAQLRALGENLLKDAFKKLDADKRSNMTDQVGY